MTLFSITQAAKQVGVSPQAVNKAIHQGRLRATRVGHCWVIEQEHLRLWNLVRTSQ